MCVAQVALHTADAAAESCRNQGSRVALQPVWIFSMAAIVVAWTMWDWLCMLVCSYIELGAISSGLLCLWAVRVLLVPATH